MGANNEMVINKTRRRTSSLRIRTLYYRVESLKDLQTGRLRKSVLIQWLGCAMLIAWQCSPGLAQSGGWQRLAIDNTFQGADGVRLADANRDGRLDIVTGWEQSGVTRIYLHPGRDAVTAAWPSVTVGQAPAVEDAVWVDLNGDGYLDVLSSCEGKEQSLRIHLSPPSVDHLLDPSAWTTEVLTASQGKSQWMYALPLTTLRTADPYVAKLVVGSKGQQAMVGMLSYLHNDATSSSTLEKLVDAKWIMSLEQYDVDGDRDMDIVYSDRKGVSSGVYWLENLESGQRWKSHCIGALGTEVMFLQVVVAVPGRQNPSEPSLTLLAAVKPRKIHRFTPQADTRLPWHETIINVEPAEKIGDAKSVVMGDLNLDGRNELVFSCEAAHHERQGIVYLTQSANDAPWTMQELGGPVGIKYDRLELIDMDFDGDLDVLTCEESEGGRGLGVIWYANPLRSIPAAD